jgi:hypothetical protein
MASGEGLVPLRHFAGEGSREARLLELLKIAWPFFVGAGHGRTTHPISIKNGTLFVGCHDSSSLEAMRASAQSIWPVLRERINSALHTHLQRIEVVPADPPEEKEAPKPAMPLENQDPLDAVLRFYRERAESAGQGR